MMIVSVNCGLRPGGWRERLGFGNTVSPTASSQPEWGGSISLQMLKVACYCVRGPNIYILLKSFKGFNYLNQLS